MKCRSCVLNFRNKAIFKNSLRITETLVKKGSFNVTCLLSFSLSLFFFSSFLVFLSLLLTYLLLILFLCVCPFPSSFNLLCFQFPFLVLSASRCFPQKVIINNCIFINTVLFDAEIAHRIGQSSDGSTCSRTFLDTAYSINSVLF